TDPYGRDLQNSTASCVGWDADMSLVRCRSPAEGDDIAVGVLDVKVLRAPCRRRQRLDDPCAIRGALRVECLDAVNAARGVEMLVLTPVLALSLVLGRFLQMKFQPVQPSNRVEPVPRLAKREAESLIVRHRARKLRD